jgi:DNA invertase Pin-like site-specific DNA recombinase
MALDGLGHRQGAQSEGRTKARPKGGRQMRAAIYARVSTTNHGQDVTLQTRELQQFAVARGWEIAGEYVDAGVSGTKDSRPELNRLIADAHKRRFDVVCVWRFDRFARSVSHLLRALETFKSLEIEFVSFSEQMDTSTPAGKMVFTVLGAVAELERSLIVERVRAGIRNARAKGKRIGRPPRTFLSPEARKSIAEAYWCRKISFRELAKTFNTSIGTVQRCALAYQKVFAAAAVSR